MRALPPPRADLVRGDLGASCASSPGSGGLGGSTSNTGGNSSGGSKGTGGMTTGTGGTGTGGMTTSPGADAYDASGSGEHVQITGPE